MGFLYLYVSTNSDAYSFSVEQLWLWDVGSIRNQRLKVFFFLFLIFFFFLWLWRVSSVRDHLAGVIGITCPVFNRMALKEIWLGLMRGFSLKLRAFNPPLTPGLFFQKVWRESMAGFDLYCPPTKGPQPAARSPWRPLHYFWRGNSSMFSFPTCSLMTYHFV